MLRDVFYYGDKPNVHPRERHADSIEHARSMSTTEHFWVINEHCDYKGFDWDWDFDFLPDEDVWAQDHNNVWPSNYQKDSGTWLCPTQLSEVIVYRNDVDPVPFKNDISSNWVILENIDKSKFDFKWHPDPTSPPYIYVWGTNWSPPELTPAVEYHTPGASERLYMNIVAALLPNKDCLVEVQKVNESKFDMSWRPDPLDPPYIYVWGNKYIPGEIKPTLEYHAPGATERKYMTALVPVEPEWDRWKINHPIDKTTFDFTWRPDPREPDFIYVFGNNQYPGTIMPTLEYHCPGATERKYMGEEYSPKLLAHPEKFTAYEQFTNFDYSWVPDPTSPPYIYAWGNQWNTPEDKISVEYVVEGATEYRYMPERVTRKSYYERWITPEHIDHTTFDYSWEPSPHEPPYIYQFGTQWQKTNGPAYIVEGATEVKYIDSVKAKALPTIDNWVTHEAVIDFDYSWHPDNTEEHYIYQWGNKFYSSELKPTVEYIVPGATEIKHMSQDVKLAVSDKWIEHYDIDKTKFDMSWRPDPTSPPYIYKWGNKHVPVELKATLEYVIDGATEVKYMPELIEVLPEFDRWKEIQAIDKSKFDLTWRPDPREPDYIYVWGNKWVQGELQPTLEYHCPDATEYKYMDELVEVLPEHERWEILEVIDKEQFDFTWRPDPKSPPYIYVFGNQHYDGAVMPTVLYKVSGATEKKYITDIIAKLSPAPWLFNTLHPVESFDYTWRPNPFDPAYNYVFGNDKYPGTVMSTVEFNVDGATETKHMTEIATLAQQPHKFKLFEPVASFDYSWVPDPTEPPYIYVWGNKWVSGKVKSTIEYHVEDATEKKFIDDNVEVLPDMKNWKMLLPNNMKSFDFTWRPDPTSPPYIYVWGNKFNRAEIEPTLEYHVTNATERKYMTETVETLPEMDKWNILIPVDNFDYTWRPDPTAPAYIYVFGNQWHDATTEPTLEYHVEGAVNRKFVVDIIAKVSDTTECWNTIIPVESFDYSWRPNPHSTPYIYVFGNQWHDSVIEPTVEYHQPGAIDKKYIVDIIATTKSTITEPHWKRLIPIESFDYSWRPDPKSPPYIYVFGNKWNDATTEPSIEYHVIGATEYKYMDEPVATPQANLAFWAINNNDDLETFDFSWRPNPHSPPQIYQWADNGPRYTIPDATEVVFMERTVETRKSVVNRYKIKTTLEDLINEHPEEVFWAINPDLNYDKFDFSWRPNEENFRHINVFGNEYSMNTQTYYVNAPLYLMGHREFNYVEGQTVEIDSNLSMFYIDRSNPESTERFNVLKERYPQLQKTRYLNSWVDTINRCINKSQTKLCWVLNSEIDYSEFEFDFYPSPWQERMVHVFGTQWSHWGTTFMVNKESFSEDTKYVKIIEHLNVLNFVKSKRTIAKNCLYPIYMIDHGNECDDTVNGISINKISYEHSYLRTFKKLLTTLSQKNEHYIWVCSSVCDYQNFDFSYICDPYAKDQLHVFPSDKQKFGDTFLIDVNKLRSLIEDMDMLEDYEKINYNQHQRVKRLTPPTVISSDTHCDSVQQEFDFPYAIFKTTDNKNLNVVDTEPMSLWAPNTKNIIVTSTGGSRIIVPKEAKKYIDGELYDYPYISRSTNLAQSQPLDIVFLSNGETGADENYEHLLRVTKGLRNRVVRVDGVNGRVAAYHAAALASNTPWMFTVFAKLKVNSKFDWSWQPDRLQVPKHYIFHATNPVNGLEYGHQAMIAYNKKITLANNGTGLDFTLDNEHEVVDINSGVAVYNTDAWSTWRTAFREALKLYADDSQASKERLAAWLNIGEGDFAQYSCEGAQHAIEYYNQVNGDLDKLRLSYDWPWLRSYFDSKYK